LSSSIKTRKWITDFYTIEQSRVNNIFKYININRMSLSSSSSYFSNLIEILNSISSLSSLNLLASLDSTGFWSHWIPWRRWLLDFYWVLCSEFIKGAQFTGFGQVSHLYSYILGRWFLSLEILGLYRNWLERCGKNHPILQENSRNHCKIEAVFRPEIFRIFSDHLWSTPAAKTTWKNLNIFRS
jgi:hypothetical protein